MALEPLLDSVRAAGLAGTPAMIASGETVEPAITTEEAEAAAPRRARSSAAPVSIRLEDRDVWRAATGPLAELVQFEPPQAPTTSSSTSEGSSARCLRW